MMWLTTGSHTWGIARLDACHPRPRRVMAARNAGPG
jgi:hypothetical protein